MACLFVAYCMIYVIGNHRSLDKFFCPTGQKIKISIKDFLSKCDQIRRKLRIWSHLLRKSFMENFIFCSGKYFFFLVAAVLLKF